MKDDETEGLTIKQKADAEAERAEAESPEDEPETEAADEPDADEEAEQEEAPPEPAPTARKGKSPQEQFEAAFQRFRANCARIFEVPISEVVPAPHAGVVGVMLPGFAEPRTHSNYKRCETCNGLGKVLTDAQTGDPSKDWHVCPDTRCKGNGYWAKQIEQPQAPATGPLAQTAPAEANGEWGEAPAWMGDPNLTPQHS